MRRYTGDKNDAEATRKHRLRFLAKPIPGNQLGQEVGSFEIGIHHFVVGLFARTGDISPRVGRDAGVVYQAVKATEMLENFAEHASTICGARDVGLHGQELLIVV